MLESDERNNLSWRFTKANVTVVVNLMSRLTEKNKIKKKLSPGGWCRQTGGGSGGGEEQTTPSGGGEEHVTPSG